MRIVQVEVQAQRCHGHGRCAVYAPAIFDFNDDGKSYVMANSDLAENQSEIERAYTACPEQAISIQKESR
jgi:ferredoxin